MTEREKFEGWYLDRFAREPMPSGYESGIAWEAWQAARATPALPQGEHDLEDVRCQCCGYMTYHSEHMGCIRSAYKQALPQVPEGMAIVPVEPTEAMLVAARDWSYKKYSKPIGDDAAQGCWQAMLAATKERNDGL